MEAALEAARAKDMKGRLAGVERLHEALDAAARRGLTPAEVASLVDTCVDLTGDGNFRVVQGALQALSAAAVLAGDHFKVHLNAFVPVAVERLGDGKQPVRHAARQLLVTLMEVSSPTIIVERAGNYAWTHKSWKVREEFVRTVAAAVGLFASTELPLQRVLLAPVLQLMNDLNQSVRDAAISCVEEVYKNMGSQFNEELQRYNLPSYMQKEINSRLNKIEPNVPSSDGTRLQSRTKECKSISASPKRGSPRRKSIPREGTLFGGKSQDGSIVDDNNGTWPRRSPKMQMDKHYTDMCYRDVSYRNSFNNHVSHFERPLRKQVVSRASASGRHSFDGGHVPSSDMYGYIDGPASLSDALSEGLSPSSDWVARVATFNFVQTLLQQGQKGVQEITQNFEKVMKLFLRYLDDPHHKVAHAALSTLADIIPVFKKPFESYIERMLPYVFSRLIDPKELVRQPCSSTLRIVGRTYSIDTLLPSLVRSLDEQRSPKAKLAVLEFASKAFNDYMVDFECYSNRGFLKLWLSKLAPLVHEKNAKLKEASISAIISVYSHFDSAAVLNFILSLSIEEQNIVRRALKKHTPRIEFDLVNYLKSKKERPHPKSYDNADSRTSDEDCYVPTLKKSFLSGRFSSITLDTEGEEMNSMAESTLLNVTIGQTTCNACIDHAKQCVEHASEAEILISSWELKNNVRSVEGTMLSWTDYPERSDATIDDENSTGTHLDIGHRFPSNGQDSVAASAKEHTQEGDPFVSLSTIKIIPHAHDEPSIPQLLHQISNDSEVSSLVKWEVLQKLVRASTNNDRSTRAKYFNQILTAVLEALDDSDPSVREVSLLLVAEMLHNQKDSLERSIEIVLEKLLHVTNDGVAKVSNEAYRCLNAALGKYDPFKCLAVIVPLLVSNDEKTLIMCISCLKKLIGQLMQEELVTQLPSFLPALFYSFSNQSPDVRKAVVSCLVDIYIMFGKTFVPYLEGLNSTQLRLVTIYANRVSQARSGATVDANQ